MDTNNKNEKDKKETPQEALGRREFLGRLAAGIGGGVMLLAYTSSQAYVFSGEGEAGKAAAGSPNYDPTKHDWVYIVDVAKCIGCGSCSRACAAENDVPEGHYRTWIERYRVAADGHVDVDSPDGGKHGFAPIKSTDEITKAFFVPKLCNHCKNTPCTQVCPVGASYQTPDKVVLVDQTRCIGCGYCIQACPYGSRFMDPRTHTATKCMLCYHRITKGLLPACVQACPRGARIFGDAKKLGDKAAQIMETRQVLVLKPDLHTDPHVQYINIGKEVE